MTTTTETAPGFRPARETRPPESRRLPGWAIKVAVGVLVAAAALAIWLWRPWAGDADAGISFETRAIDRGVIQASVTATGTLSPRNNIEVGAQVSGRISEVLVDFNDRVEHGQVIARIDPRVFEAQVTQARANLAVARATRRRHRAILGNTEKQHRRVAGLAAAGIVSTAELDAADAELDSARANVEAQGAVVHQAEAALEQARLNRSFTTIVSPVDGVVIDRAIDVGQTVAASFQAPVLFVIAEDLSKMQIDTSVAESDIGVIIGGQRATFSVDAFADREFEGTVREVRNTATTVQGVVTYNAVIDVENREGLLRPGMTCNVTFVLAELADALRIPNAALRFRPDPRQLEALGIERSRSGERRRQLADDQRAVWKLVDGKPVRVRVKIGLRDSAYTAALEGDLKPGDALITEIAGGPIPSRFRGRGAF